MEDGGRADAGLKGKIAAYKERYWGNYHDRTLTASHISFVINALIGVGKLILGLAVRSPWFIATAVYYLLLCAARGEALRQYRKAGAEASPSARFRRQRRVYRRGGGFICLLAISYFLVCLRMYTAGDHSRYPYYILYGVAAVAFYKIGMAIYGIVITGRMKNPLLSTLKAISLVDACVSIVAVQCALLVMKESPMATTSSALLGMGCSMLFLGFGLFMLLRRRTPSPAENSEAEK